jgi:NAD-dependent deacetylase
MDPVTPDVVRMANLIASAQRILLVTGAGVSTRAGIPDYRGPNGVWRTQRPVEFGDFLRSEDKRIEYWGQKLASSEALAQATPTEVHRAAVRLEEVGKLEAIVTQNIDGLHSDAGSSKGIVVEVHGTAREASCLDCGARGPIEPFLDSFASTRRPPMCDECGGLIKPATISFGQALDALSIARATQAAERCDLVIALGSTLSVYPAAAIPLEAAQRGVPYVIVNLGPTDHDSLPSVALRIEEDVAEAFPAAVEDALDRS